MGKLVIRKEGFVLFYAFEKPENAYTVVCCVEPVPCSKVLCREP